MRPAPVDLITRFGRKSGGREVDTEKVCTQCGKHCVPAQACCPKCGSPLPAATPVTPDSASSRGSHQLIMNKCAEERIFECEDEEQALNQAMPWVIKGYSARIADEQGVVKWTQALSEGQVAVFKDEATVQRGASGRQAPSGQTLAPPKIPRWRFW
jgi:hypothetical protein